MAVISTGNHPKALWPGVHKFVMGEYKEHPLECKLIFDVEKSSMAYEEDVETTGFGLAPVKAEAQATQYDSHSQGGISRYTHVAYSLGYIVTYEELQDNLYKTRSFRRGKQLSFSFRTTKETVSANVLNRAFNASYTGGVDGNNLLATDHATLSGDQSNTLATPADLSEASLEALLTQIAEAKNARGLQIALRGQRLIVPPAEHWNAERILKSTQRSGTDFNDVNALMTSGALPQGSTVNHYLTDSDAWFVKTDAPNGMTMFERQGFKFTKDNDFDTDNAKAKGYERYSVGWSDWRGMYGSEGAA